MTLSSLIVVIQELRRVVYEEGSTRNYTGRITPQLLGFTREDDSHVLLRGFTAGLDLDIKLSMRCGGDLPPLDRLLVVPDLLASARHES